MTTTNETTVKDSGVKIAEIVRLQGKEVIHRREMTCVDIANDITSRITGKLVGFEDIFDPKTNSFLSEDQLVAKGARFVTVSFDKTLKSGSDTVVKGRTTKIPTPVIRKIGKWQLLINIDWQSYINYRSSHGLFVADTERSNKVENYENCKAIGIKTNKDGKTYYYICGVVFRSLEPTRYLDENGREYPDQNFIKSEFLNKVSEKSRQKEADKHGIELAFDPQYRDPRIDNCAWIRGFGFEYVPIKS